MSAQSITLTDINTITFDATGDIFEASVLSGATLTVKGDGNVADLLGATETTAAQTLDFSNITIDNTLATGAGGLAITTNNGVNSVTGSGGADTITGGTGIDTIIGGAGGDTIIGGQANDVITGGEGADKIDIRSGTDSVSLGEATAAADVLLMNGGLTTVTGFDFGGTATDDNIQMDISGIEGALGGTSNLVDMSAADVAAATTAVKTITGAAIIGAGTEDILILSGNVADNAALNTALETGGTFQLTATNAFADEDAILVAYDNGTNSFIAHVEFDSTVGTGATTTALTCTTMMTLTGVSDVTKILAADFAAIIA
jgi:hypothetical protein